MVCSISNMNITLPSIHTIVSDLSPSPSPTLSGRGLFSPNSIKKELNDDRYVPPRLTLPIPTPDDLKTSYVRRESTCSTSSAPSLTHSPSPSPPPTRPSSPDSFFLVPCDLQMADAVIVISDPSTPMTSNGSPKAGSRSPSPVFRTCKPSEARATLLIGPAISTHGRRNSARMHPYRIVRDRK